MGLLGENGGWSVRGVMEISVRVRALIISKYKFKCRKEMSLVRNELFKFLNIISKL